MSHQLDNVTFQGQQVSVTLSTFNFTLPSEVTMSKIDDHTVLMNVNLTSFAPKWMPSIIAALLGYRTVSWNLDNGSINVR
jgi:hypothetical protein